MASTSGSSSPVSRLCLGGEIVQEKYFRMALSEKMYESLSDEAKKYLNRFLPNEKYKDSTKNSLDNKIVGLTEILTDDKNFFFGNPLQIVYAKIRCGWFNPERPADKVQLRDNCTVRYDHYIREYHINMIKKLHIARQRAFNHILSGRRGSPLRAGRALKQRIEMRRRLKERADFRYKLMIEDVKKRADDRSVSSDDEEILRSVDRILTKRAGSSSLYKQNFPDLDLHHPIYRENVSTMLKQYMKRKKRHPNSPDLEFNDITPEAVYERSGVSYLVERNLPAEVTEALKMYVEPPRYSSKELDRISSHRYVANDY